MKIHETPIRRALVVEAEPIADERGTFARTYSRQAFEELGIVWQPVESNVSSNAVAGTLRGMHFQADPLPDPKLVSCIRGSLFDVVVDLRPDSTTRGEWFAVVLNANNHKSLFVPPGCAHGFMTLEDDTTVHYLMGEHYVQALSGGVRWNDPAFAIEWPREPVVMSERDAQWPDWSPEAL